MIIKKSTAVGAPQLFVCRHFNEEYECLFRYHTTNNRTPLVMSELTSVLSLHSLVDVQKWSNSFCHYLNEM